MTTTQNLTAEQSFYLECARDAKAVRDAEGIERPEYDAQLARFEAGDFSRVGAGTLNAGEITPQRHPVGSDDNQHTSRRPAPATEKQVAFIVSLSEQVKGTPHEYLGLTEHKAEALSKSEASNVIGELKAVVDTLPRKPRQQPAQRTQRVAAEPGLYKHEGTIVKVQSNRAHTGVYAKRLNVSEGEYVYTAGLQYQVSDKLTLDEAIAIAADAQHALNGHCVLCNRELTDELSISLGIGPECRKKF